MTIGQKLTALRKARGMTQEELSEAIGVTRQTISKWELDTSTPDLDYLCKLCDLFEVTADYLIRPEREEVETSETAKATETGEASPLPSAPPPSPSESKEISGTRFTGFALMILGLLLTQLAFLFMLFSHDSTIFWILAGVAFIFGAELYFIRRKPLFIVMWTAWAMWTASQAVITGRMIFSLIFSLRYEHILPVNWTWIFAILWLLYTAFCIGVTVGLIVKHLRGKRKK